MKTEAEQLRDELSRIIDEQTRTDPTLPPEVPIALIQRVVAHLQQQRARGKTLAQCALELGVPKGRLHYWLYQRHRPRPSPDEPPPRVRPVQVSSELVPVLDGVPERRYILRSPAGWELRELTLQELTELLRSLT